MHRRKEDEGEKSERRRENESNHLVGESFDVDKSTVVAVVAVLAGLVQSQNAASGVAPPWPPPSTANAQTRRDPDKQEAAPGQHSTGHDRTDPSSRQKQERPRQKAEVGSMPTKPKPA